MKKEEELIRDLREMVKDTKAGKVNWKIIEQTTEYNDSESKPIVDEDGTKWQVDECYVSFNCEYKEKEFLMITYEMIHTAADVQRTTNLVFLPPLGIRYFDLNTLLPYSVEASQMLTYHIHELWKLCLDMYKNKQENVSLEVTNRVLTIED